MSPTPPSRRASEPAAAAPAGAVPLRQFAALKLRMLGNGMSGRPGAALLFAGGVVAGVLLAQLGFALFAVTAAADPTTRLVVAGLGGATLVLGAAVMPLIWFGVDDSLDPARFALLPLSRWRLIAGLFVAALVSVPAAAVLVATTGLLVPAAVGGGLVGAGGQLLGILLGLLLCVAAARAVTSAFASILRSRRVRELAGVLIGLLAVMLGPLQLLLFTGAQPADWGQLRIAAQVAGWTPLAAPYTVGWELAEGSPAAALAKLLIAAGAVLLLLWWWARSLESAMEGSASGRPARAPRRGRRGGAVAQLLLRGLPASGSGAIVARELRYWWRDPRRRTNLAMILVLGALLPVLMFAGSSRVVLESNDAVQAPLADPGPIAGYALMLFVGALAATVLANQFGFDGTAHGGHLIAGVPGRLELRARAVAYSLLLVPLLLVVGGVQAVVAGDAAMAPGAWGMLFAGFGAGVAVSTLVSVLASYPMPEGSNPFAASSGSALAKSMLALLAIGAATLIALPVLIAGSLLGGLWLWLAVPVGLGYGLLAGWLGCQLAGQLLDRRGPELLEMITPRS